MSEEPQRHHDIAARPGEGDGGSLRQAIRRAGAESCRSLEWQPDRQLGQAVLGRSHSAVLEHYAEERRKGDGSG